MKNIKYIILIIIISALNIKAADISGIVYGYDVNQKRTPLIGATVIWENTNSGAQTNSKGEFKLKKSSKSNVIIVSYTSYQTFKQEIGKDITKIEVQLEPSTSDAVTVYGKQSALILSESAINTREISFSGLQKAACCNLSESFTADPSVDVNYTDAVTGAKQIELLGLEGIYTQMMTENIPNLRGLATTYGLNYVPGQWMESIQISKGAASVTAGYESVTGQINVEYKKPSTSEKLFLNLYGNTHGMLEADAVTKLRITDNLNTNLMLHYNYFGNEIDHNDDMFLDHPLETQYGLMNKWEYENNGLHTIHTIKALNETRKSGQTGYFSNNDKSKYGIQIQTERYELFGKMGYVLPTTSYNSIAGMYALSTHNQNSYYGLKNYDGNQKSFFGKILYETRFGHKKEDHEGHNHSEDHEGHNHSEAEDHEGHNHSETMAHSDDGEFEEYNEDEEMHSSGEHEANEHIHKINLGASFNYDEYQEHYTNNLQNAINLKDTTINKIERVPGVFIEYTYTGIEEIAIIAGARYDFHNIYGNLFTPRLHVKYQPIEEISLRGSVGKGYHLPNIFAENAGLFISSRDIFINEPLNPEEAINYGINATFLLNLFNTDFTINTDYYRTDFINQTIVDLERNPGQVHFYNLDGKSYSNAYQIDITFSPIVDFTVMAAYRYNDVKMTVNGELIEKPLASRYKTYLNLAYVTPEGMFKFDVTGVVNGGGTIPSTELNPIEYRLPKTFDPFFTLQAQVTFNISNFEIYVGGENLTNYMISHPIIAYNEPFGEYFDGSMVWGPMLGRKIYAGARFKLD